ncbi:MAG: histone deacetylase [Treponema sp.]|jgi:acetoin utilization deacetylase AcuC-like enzyme|nr:histone deacetylase [Treponema sp.]
MILYDPDLIQAHTDYGIMIPISPARASRIIAFLTQTGVLRTHPLKPVFDCPGARCFLGESPGPLINREDLERVHQKEFIAMLYEEGPEGSQGLLKALLHAYELIDSQGQPHRYEPDRAVKPLKALFHLTLAQVEGTYLACRLALKHEGPTPGFCYYLGGGMHHARYDQGAGFCLIHDIMIGARKLQAEHRARGIWIIDLDAHKGCGTAELVHFSRIRGELGGNEGAAPAPEIRTLSIHMAKGWPLDEETLRAAPLGRAPWIKGDVEICIEAGAEDTYVPELQKGLELLEKDSNLQPDLAIVIDGSDPYEHDGLPSSSLLKLSLDCCIERDRLIYQYLRQQRIPSAWIMAGGYGERAWEPNGYFLQTLSEGNR